MEVASGGKYRGKYPRLAATSHRFRIIILKWRDNIAQIDDFNSFISAMITMFQVQIPRELLTGEKQRTFRLWVANQSRPSVLSTVLTYTRTD